MGPEPLTTSTLGQGTIAVHLLATPALRTASDVQEEKTSPEQSVPPSDPQASTPARAKPRLGAAQELEPQELAWIFLAVVVGIVIMTVSLLLIVWRVLAQSQLLDQRPWVTSIDLQQKDIGSIEDINFALTAPSPPPMEMLHSSNDTPPQINLDTPPPFPYEQPPRMVLPEQPLPPPLEGMLPRWQKELIRAGWIALVLVCFLVSVFFFLAAMDDLELRGIAKDASQSLTLRQLLDRGPRGNHHVAVNDFHWSGNYIAEKATPNRWNWVVVVLTVNPEHDSPHPPLVARFRDVHSLKELQKKCAEPALAGVLRPIKGNLEPRAYQELTESGFNLIQGWLLEAGLSVPSRAAMIGKFLGSLLACGVGLLPILGFVRGRWLRIRPGDQDLDPATLGLPIRVHATTMQTKLLMLLLSLGVFGLAGLSLYFWYNPQFVPQALPRGFLLGAAIFLMLLGVVGLLVTWSLHSVTYVIYSHGLLQKIGSKHHFVRWDEIKDIWQLGMPPMPPRYRFVLIDNEVVDLRNSIRDVEALGEYITEKVNERYLPAAIITLNKGGVVSFGPLDISRSGLSYKDKFLPWRNIKKVIAGYNEKAKAHILEIRSVGKSQHWIIQLNTIPNLRVFYQLVQNYCSGTIKKSVDNYPPA